MNKYFLLALIVLSSCATPNNTIKNTDINGIVEFPNFKTKAIYTDISTNATVSIFHPKANKDFPDRAFYSNQAISTSQTDSGGSFTIHNDNFYPAINRVYVLEVMKRLNSNNLTLRTFIKWNGESWLSMTYPDLKINTKTTALSIIANSENIDELQTIGKIDISSGISVVSNIGISPNIVTSDSILNVSNLVTKSLEENKDPFSSIINDGFYHIDRTYEIGKLKQTGNCVNCSFVGYNLPDILANANLTGADLSEQYLTSMNITNTNLQGSNLSDSILSNMDLTVLANKNLSNSIIKNALLDGVNLSGIQNNLFNLSNTDFTDSDLSYSNLRYTNLTNAKLNNTDLSYTDLTNSNVTNTNFSGADLSNTTWIDGVVFGSNKICDNNSIGQCN